MMFDFRSELTQFDKDMGLGLEEQFSNKKPIPKQKKKCMNKKRCKGCTRLIMYAYQLSCLSPNGTFKPITSVLSPCPNKVKEV